MTLDSEVKQTCEEINHEELLSQVIVEHSEQMAKIPVEKRIAFLVGKAMKASHGKANPEIIRMIFLGKI